MIWLFQSALSITTKLYHNTVVHRIQVLVTHFSLFFTLHCQLPLNGIYPKFCCNGSFFLLLSTNCCLVFPLNTGSGAGHSLLALFYFALSITTKCYCTLISLLWNLVYIFPPIVAKSLVAFGKVKLYFINSCMYGFIFSYTFFYFSHHSLGYITLCITVYFASFCICTSCPKMPIPVGLFFFLYPFCSLGLCFTVQIHLQLLNYPAT